MGAHEAKQRVHIGVLSRVVLLLVGALGLALAGGPQPRPKARVEQGDLAFLENHWKTPVPPQGPAPERFSAVEASLAAASCGACHPTQYQDWKRSLHAKAMGPGVFGQTVDLIEQDPSTALLCYSCHTPLAEQSSKMRGAGGQIVAQRAFQKALQEEGLTCAACHVRGHERFGPARRPDVPAADLPREKLPHHGVTRTKAFERSEFCRGCHQFAPDDLALNGKLLENTFNEWKEGPYAKEGRQCQDCHMPDRRHLWRGIHDPEMVKQAVSVALRVARRAARPGQMVDATVTVTNRGAGHMFPTYVTPQVFVRGELVDAAGRPIPGTLEEQIIGRGISLDLSRELYDTRIPPRGTSTFRYARKAERAGLRLRAWVTVYPDYHYVAVFKSMLPAAGPKGRPLLEQALRNAEGSHFEIFRAEEPVS